MKRFFTAAAALILFSFLSTSAVAQWNWTAGGDGTNWSDQMNWDSGDGTPGNDGSPTAVDAVSVFFFGSFTINVDVTASCASFSTAAFSASTLNINNPLTVGGAFTVGLNTTANVNSTLNVAGTFSNQATTNIGVGSTVNYNGTGSQTLAALNYDNLTVSGARAATPTITLPSGTIGVSGTFSYTTTGAYTISNTGSIFDFNGTASQTIPMPSVAFYREVQVSNSNASGATLGAAVTATNVTGDITVVSGGILDNGGNAITGTGSNNFNVNNGGTFELSGGSFPSSFASISLGTTSTVEYSSSSSQTLQNTQYGNLTSSSSGARVINGSVQVSGTFTPGTNSYTVTGSTVDFNGTGAQTIPAFDFNNLTIGSTGTKTLASGTIRVAGNISLTGGNAFTVTGNTVEFNGTGTQTVSTSRTVATYNNLTINKSSGTATLNGAVTATNVAGSITVSNGTLDNAGNAIAGGAGDAFTLQSGTTLTLGGTTGLPTGFGTLTLNGGSTVEYNSPSAQTVGAADYGNLLIAGARTTNNVTLANGGTINIAGTFTDAATFGSGSYVTTGNTVRFNGASNQTIPPFTFNNLTIASGATTSSITGPAIANGTFTLESGTIAVGASNTLNLNGAVVYTAGSVNNTGANSEIVYAGGALQVVLPGTYVDVDFNSETKNLSNRSITITGDFTNTVASGNTTTNSTVEFSGTTALSVPVFNYNNLTISGARTTNNVTLPNGTLSIGGDFTASTTFTSGDWIPGIGTIDYNSSSPQNIAAINYNNLTNTGNGNRTLPNGTVDISGTFTPGSGTYTAGSGTVNYSGGGGQVIAAINYNNLSSDNADRTFENGSIDIGGTFTAGSGTYTPGSSTVNFSGGNGQTIPAISYNNLSSANSNRTISTGTVNISGTFTPGSGTYTVTGTTINYDGANGQTIAAFTYNNLSSSDDNRVLANGTIDIAGTFTTGTGTYTPGSSTINFSSALAQTIPAINYNNITNTGNGNRTLASSGTIGIAGSFTPGSGTYTTTGSTVDFESAGAQSIPAVTYYNLETSNGGTKTLAAAIDMGGNLTVGTGTTLATGGNNVNIEGDFTVDGAFTHGSAEIIFDGTGGQDIAGTATIDVNDLEIGTSSNTVVETTVNLSGTLELVGGGTFDADGAGGARIFTVVSTSESAGGRIAELPTPSNFTGDVTMQRFLSENGDDERNWVHLVPLTTDATIADWQDDFAITGSFTGASTGTGLGSNSSLSYYNETITTGDLNDGYENFTTTNAATLVPTNVRALAVFVRGDRDSDTPITQDVVDSRGPIFKGTVTQQVSFTTSGTLADDGWNFIGNPYPSAIDWDDADWSKGTSIVDVIYIKNASTGVYGVYEAGGGGASTLPNGRIAPGQGFWVKFDSNTDATLSSTEGVKTTGSASIQKVATPDNSLKIALSNGNITDFSFVFFDDNATLDYDSGKDLFKFYNDEVNLSINPMPGLNLLKSTMPSFDCETSLPLSVDNVADGDYSLAFTQLTSFGSDVEVRLVDSHLGSEVTLTEGMQYDFAVSAAEPTSFGSSRFSLVFDYVDTDTSLGVSHTDICGASSDGSVTVMSSQPGVTYKVQLGGVDITSSQIGDGSDLNFTILSQDVAIGSNTLQVFASRDEQCEALHLDQEVQLTRDDIPDLPAAVVQSAICDKGSTILVASGSASENYHWYETIDSTDPIDTDASFETPILSSTRSYFVSALTAAGCESSRLEVIVDVEALPSAPQASADVICNQGSTNIVASGAAVDGSYRWYETLSSVDPIAGETDATFTTPELSASRSYFVSIISSNGCEGPRQEVNVEVSLLAQPVITNTQGEVLESSSASGNQWYLNGVLISGATDQTYEATESGTYTVVVTSGSCSATSDSFDLVVVSLEDDGIAGLKLYPIPASETLNVEYAGISSSIEISLMNISGKQLTAKAISTVAGKAVFTSFDINGLESGVYFVRIIDGKTVINSKFVKN